jgi:hypothetical protein
LGEFSKGKEMAITERDVKYFIFENDSLAGLLREIAKFVAEQPNRYFWDIIISTTKNDDLFYQGYVVCPS